jgi:hypothetical protein
MTEHKISFFKGAALTRDRYATLAYFDAAEQPGEPGTDTYIAEFNAVTATWREIAVRRWIGEAVAAYQLPGIADSGVVVLSRYNDVLIETSGRQIIEEKVFNGVDLPGTGAQRVTGRTYLLGATGFFLWRNGNDQWVPIDTDFYRENAEWAAIPSLQRTIREAGVISYEEWDQLSAERQIEVYEAMESRVASFYSIGGFRHDDLYLGGLNGLFMHFDGNALRFLDIAASSSLTEVRVHNGEVWVCGGSKKPEIFAGTAAAGFRKVLSGRAGDSYPYTMDFLSGSLYVGDPSVPTPGLYTFGGGVLARVQTGLSPEIGPVFRVEAIDGVLWVLEGKALNRFDGAKWGRFTSPRN